MVDLLGTLGSTSNGCAEFSLKYREVDASLVRISHRNLAPTIKYNPPGNHDAQNDMKVFAEATLGNTVDNSKRAGFIKYDRNVLRFQAVWDDRESLYGDIQRFEVGTAQYYRVGWSGIRPSSKYRANLNTAQAAPDQQYQGDL